MTPSTTISKIYTLSSDLIQYLETIRDYEEDTFTPEMQKELDIFNKIWDLCRESKYLVEPRLDENGKLSFDFVTREWIKEMLENTNTSQKELAEGVNATAPQVSTWLSGVTNPSGPAQAAIFYFFAQKIQL